jgi:hypothetical protein
VDKCCRRTSQADLKLQWMKDFEMICLDAVCCDLCMCLLRGTQLLHVSTRLLPMSHVTCTVVITVAVHGLGEDCAA